MLTKESALDLIYQSLDELNSGRDPECRISLQPDTRLLGEDGLLDSLDVVEMIVNLETQLSRRLNHEVTLLDEHLLSQKNSPLHDVASLAAFLTNGYLEQ